MTIFPQRLQIVGCCVLVLALAALAGCGNKKGVKQNFNLKGKVTYKGEPVTGGSLKLNPIDGKSPPVTSQITNTGTYQLVPPGLGEMKVTIETESVRGSTERNMNRPEAKNANLPIYVPIPPRYATLAGSDLKVTIVEGPNEQDFNLVD